MATSDLTARLRTDGETWEIYLPVPPVPAARPRVGRWGTYYPKTYQRWMAEADQLLRPLAEGAAPSPEDIHVAVHTVALKPKTGKLPAPRGDVDNYAKAALDAITKAQLVWCDDKQLITMQATKRYAVGAETPHTFIRASLSMGGVWLADPLEGGDDVYDLPPSMRVPLELVEDEC